MKNFQEEYQIQRKLIYEAAIEFRRKRARKWLISWLIARGLEFNEIENHYIEDLKISKFDYEKAVKQQRISSGSIKEDMVSKRLRKGH